MTIDDFFRRLDTPVYMRALGNSRPAPWQSVDRFTFQRKLTGNDSLAK